MPTSDFLITLYTPELSVFFCFYILTLNYFTCLVKKKRKSSYSQWPACQFILNHSVPKTHPEYYFIQNYHIFEIMNLINLISDHNFGWWYLKSVHLMVEGKLGCNSNRQKPSSSLQPFMLKHQLNLHCMLLVFLSDMKTNTTLKALHCYSWSSFFLFLFSLPSSLTISSVTDCK